MQRHHEDVCVSECHTGGMGSAGFGSIDLWTMKRSYAHPRITAYEVKVSKGDFRRDDKWPKYLPFCNELYFVCPWRMVAPTELPAEAGLMYVTKTGERLRIMKKAQYRPGAVKESVLRYILISRAEIKPPRNTPEDRTEYWRDWLARAKEGKAQGWEIRSMVKPAFQDMLARMDAECKAATNKWNDLVSALTYLGINQEDHPYMIAQRIRELGGVGIMEKKEMYRRVDSMAKRMAEFAEFLKPAEAPGPAGDIAAPSLSGQREELRFR